MSENEKSGILCLTNSKCSVLWLWVIITTIFVVLYRNFLFNGYAYIYKDIGSDTIMQYFPYYIFDGIQFRTGNASHYSLQMGLGGVAFERIVALLNPFEFILLLCNNETLYIGLIVSQYLKTVCMGFFAFLYFKSLFKNECVAMICSIMWAFCSYVTLWGQHYTFSTNMVYFTIFMYVLHLYLQTDTKFSKGVPLIVFMFALRGYYILYMVGIFSVVYTIAYGIYERKTIKQIVTKVVCLGLLAILGILMAAFLILVSVGAFLDSERSAGVSQSLISRLFYFRDWNYLITVIGRVISNDTLGIGNSFEGWGNYYEAPMLFTSNLMVLSVVFCINQKNGWRKGIICLICIFSVFSSAISIIMTGFSGEYLRWTFIICFVELMGIGCMLNHILNDANIKHKPRIIIMSLCIYLVMYYILYDIKKMSLNTYEIKCSMIFVILYMLWLLFYKIENRNRMMITIFIIVSIEMIICNNRMINWRDLLSVEEAKSYTTDGTMELVNYMKNNDDDLYRSVKTYGTWGLNDALVQGYNSLSWYESVLPSSVNAFMDENNVPSLLYRSCINIPVNRYSLITLLGTRYVVAGMNADLDLDNYEIVYKNEDKMLLRNKNALSFGYIYDKQARKEEMQNLELYQKDNILTQMFYLSDGKIEKDILLCKNIDDYKEKSKLKELSRNGMKNVQLKDNELSGTIENREKDTVMLCVPIFYEKNWIAYIDGKEQQVLNINGGLLGVCIESGKHTVKIIYKNRLLIYGAIVSAVAVMFYISMTVLYRRRENL